MIDDLDRIMRVMDAAFDPAFGEAWSRRQVADALVIPGTNYLLAGADGNPPPPGEPAAAFALSRTGLDENPASGLSGSISIDARSISSYAKASGSVASKAIKALANIESGSPLSTMHFCSHALRVMAAGPA